MNFGLGRLGGSTKMTVVSHGVDADGNPIEEIVEEPVPRRPARSDPIAYQARQPENPYQVLPLFIGDVHGTVGRLGFAVAGLGQVAEATAVALKSSSLAPDDLTAAIASTLRRTPGLLPSAGPLIDVVARSVVERLPILREQDRRRSEAAERERAASADRNRVAKLNAEATRLRRELAERDANDPARRLEVLESQLAGASKG